MLCRLFGHILQASAQPLAGVVAGTQTGIGKGTFVEHTCQGTPMRQVLSRGLKISTKLGLWRVVIFPEILVLLFLSFLFLWVCYF